MRPFYGKKSWRPLECDHSPRPGQVFRRVWTADVCTIMASGAIFRGNDYIVVLPQVVDAASGQPVLDMVATFEALANWDGQSGGVVASGPMTLDVTASSEGTYIGVMNTNGMDPSMNPVAIQVNGENYNVVRRTVCEVSW